jgi:hypothetical protein
MDFRGSLVTSAASAAAAAVIAAASAATAGATTCAALLCLEAIAAEYRTISSGLKRNSGLLAASGADYCRSCGCAGAIATAASAVAASAATAKASSATGLVGLLGLSARLAALRRRISPFLEERLVSSSKCKFPSAVATGKLQISSHGVSPFSVCENP